MQKKKRVLLTVLFILVMTFGMNVFAADEGKADVIIQHLSGDGGLLECYKEGEDQVLFTKAIPVGAKTIVLEEMEQGNYKLLVKGGIAVYEPMQFSVVATYDSTSMTYQAEDIYIQAKYQTPTLIKTADKQTAKVGDVVTYTLLIDIPQFVGSDVEKEFFITDMPSEGLAIDESSIHFYACNAAGQKVGEALVTSDVAKVSMGLDGSMVIEIDNDSYSVFCERVGGTRVILEYQATITKYASSLKSNENYAALQYRDVEESDFTNVHTYGVRVYKKTEDGEALSGAVFSLFQGGKALKFYPEVIEGIGYALYPNQNETDKSKYITEIPVDAGGTFVLSGLDLGMYTLKEVQAPTGYFISTKEIGIVLQDNEPDGILDGEDVSATKPNQVEKIVYNYKTIFDVPVTGSWSFGAYLCVGAALVVLGLGLIRYEKKKHTC